MLNYAHRGASSYAPENTWPAFELGIELNANGIETDVRKTKDGVLVLFHDDSLKRIVGVEGGVEDYTYAQLSEFDFGLFKGEQYRGEKIVSMEGFVSRYGRKDLSLAIELKGKEIELDVCRMLEDKQVSNYIVTSFDYSQLLKVRKRCGSTKIGYLTDCFSREMVDKLVRDRVDEICPKAELLTPSICTYAHKSGLSIRAWGVKDYDLMVHCCLCGVDGMTVNFPDLLDAYLKRLC